jgi:hypothetical protein
MAVNTVNNFLTNCLPAAGKFEKISDGKANKECPCQQTCPPGWVAILSGGCRATTSHPSTAVLFWRKFAKKSEANIEILRQSVSQM